MEQGRRSGRPLKLSRKSGPETLKRYRIEMTTNSVSENQRKTSLVSASIFHIFHDGIADGLAIFLPLWQASFGLTLTQVGLLVTCFESATGLFQIPAGFLGEHFNERKLLVLGTLITAISFMFLGLVGGMVAFIVLLFIGGIGAAVQHPIAASIVSKAYNEDGRRMALGTYNFSGDVGKFLFPALGALMFSQIGWRFVCVGFGLIGCVIAVALFFVLGNAVAKEKALYGKTHQEPLKRNDWGIVNKGAFSTLSLIGIVDTAVRMALVTFLPFLLIQKGIRAESVGFALSLMFIGGAVGKFLCGALAERIGIIATVMITEGITGCGILLLTFLPFPDIYYFLPVLGVALNGTSSVLYGTVADFVETHRVARAFGLFYTFVIAASAVAPPIMGRVSDILGVDDSVRAIGWIALTTLPMALILWKQMIKKNIEK